MNKRVKILLQILSIVFVFVGLAVGVYILSRPKEIEIKQAATTPTINDFKTSYSTMLARYNETKRYQLFSGGLVLAEFDGEDNEVYAGHLGNFWAPPFYSSHSTNGSNPPSSDYVKAFNHGLVFYNVGHGGGIPESPTDINTEIADWYPSKIVMEHHYPGGGGGTQVRGVKVALPNTRGMGLKVTMTNLTSTTQSQRLLFLGWLPTFDKLVSWPRDLPRGWNWMQGISNTAKTKTQYDSSNKIILMSDTTNGSYMAVGLNSKTDTHSWGTDVGNYDMYSYFLNQGAGSLANTNNDSSSNNGSAFGLVGDFSNLAPSQSKTMTMIIGIADNASDAKQIVLDNRSKDIEAESDNFWNNRLASVFRNLPSLSTGDSYLNSIYQNAVLSYLVNRWEIFSTNGDLGQAAGFGQSTSLFPWFTGTTSILAMADSSFWKSQLIKLLDLDYSNCRADEVVVGIDLCDTTYSYNPYTLLQAVYDYVTITGDFSFLTTSRYNRLNSLIAADDNKEKADGLVDFGSDSNLYEFDRHCDLDGKYTGKVITPNADRIVAHRNLADLAKRLGDTQEENRHLDKADAIKNSIQKLWDSSKGIFYSIPSGTTTKVNFQTVLPYLLFQYDDVLTTDQINKMVSKLSDYKGTRGLTSLPLSQSSTWCSNEDWHGPGLYSGAAGAVIEGLFKQDYSSEAYDILKRYQYLANMPYFSQAMPYNLEKYALAPAYMEGIAFAQAIVRGMFGIYTN
ncbi:MAG: hypothetical protein JSV32_01795, partial [Dehalococcoidia bacterium]